MHQHLCCHDRHLSFSWPSSHSTALTHLPMVECRYNLGAIEYELRSSYNVSVLTPRRPWKTAANGWGLNAMHYVSARSNRSKQRQPMSSRRGVRVRRTDASLTLACSAAPLVQLSTGSHTYSSVPHGSPQLDRQSSYTLVYSGAARSSRLGLQLRRRLETRAEAFAPATQHKAPTKGRGRNCSAAPTVNILRVIFRYVTEYFIHDPRCPRTAQSTLQPLLQGRTEPS
ncbi:hypothetical protein AOLI_G00294320 [Acnodon oligacanthus]